jgi:hypothetical protein
MKYPANFVTAKVLTFDIARAALISTWLSPYWALSPVPTCDGAQFYAYMSIRGHLGTQLSMLSAK